MQLRGHARKLLISIDQTGPPPNREGFGRVRAPLTQQQEGGNLKGYHIYGGKKAR
jgi:hypothetical protein